MPPDPSSSLPSLSVPWVRVMLIKDVEPAYVQTIRSSDDVATLSQDMRLLDREEFRILLLNTKHHVIGAHTVSLGSLNTSIIHPREVFKAAILANAHAIIGVHNHPSGDPSPSPEDHALTKRLSEAGALLGIALLDHIVLGSRTHYSFADNNNLASSLSSPSP